MRRRTWGTGYVALGLAPLALVRILVPEGDGRLGVELAVAFGLLALSTSVLQFALVSRAGRTSREIGADRLLALHRVVAYLIVAFVVLHVILLVPAAPWADLRFWAGPSAWRPGAAAVWALAILVGTSVWRRRLHLSFEAWQRIHLGSALALVVGSAWHALRIGRYAAHPGVASILIAYVSVALVLVARARVVRPWQLRRRPWRVDRNEDAGGGARWLRLLPVDHPGMPFEAGQFAWLLTGRSPAWSEEHPLSLAAAPSTTGGIEFLIKALGDWSSRTVPALRCGTTVWVDGPFGGFTPRTPVETRLVLIAGGIGIAPIRAILQTLRGSGRPVTVIIGASEPSRLVAADDVATCAAEANATLVHVFEHPPPGWRGERGYVTADLLRRCVPTSLADAEFLVCGPLAMIDAVTAALTSLGVPASRVTTERFEMV